MKLLRPKIYNGSSNIYLNWHVVAFYLRATTLRLFVPSPKILNYFFLLSCEWTVRENSVGGKGKKKKKGFPDWSKYTEFTCPTLEHEVLLLSMHHCPHPTPSLPLTSPRSDPWPLNPTFLPVQVDLLPTKLSFNQVLMPNPSNFIKYGNTLRQSPSWRFLH